MRKITYAQAIRHALKTEILDDPRVFIMGEDIGLHGGAFGVTAGLLMNSDRNGSGILRLLKIVLSGLRLVQP